MNVYTGKKRVDVKSNEEEELYEFDEDEDEDEIQEETTSNPELNASDIENEQVDDYIPDQKAWGKKRVQYYDADFVDNDYSTYTKEEEEYALAEEQEAQEIQKRLAQQLNDIDCDLELFNATEKGKELNNTVYETKLKVDFSNLSNIQKFQIFGKESPEFESLVSDFENNLNSLKKLYIPLVNYARLKNSSLPIFKIIQTRVTVTNLYLTNLAFYLFLKVRKVQFKGHPLVKKLAQIKQLLTELDKKIENFDQQLHNLRIIIKGNDDVICISQEKQKNYAKVQVGINSKSDSDEDDVINEEDNERRGITYQIAKNKGLTPHRKKENRNPRVKHRMKFRKALIRRKGAVRTVRKETTRYDGEISGIKATVRKSTKLK